MTKKIAWVMVLPSILIFLGLGVFPLVYSLWLSLQSYSLLDMGRGIKFVGLNNFVKLFHEQGVLRITFLQSLWITTVFVGVSLFLEIIIGLLIALLISRERSSELWLLKILFFLPILLAPVVIGYAWNFLYQYQYGFINYLLASLRLPILKWLTNPSLALVSLIIADVWEWSPFSFLVLLAAILSIPKERLEAANVDGTGSWERLLYIILPGIKRSILVILLIRSIELIKTIDLVYAITYGGPITATRVISFNAYMLAFKHFEMGEAAAYSYLILIPINVIVLLFLNVLREETG